MSVLIKRSNKIQTFPMEIYKHLLLRFNGVTQFNIITISSTTLEISFKKFVGCSTTVPIRLFSKLASAMKTIKEKYLTYNDKKVHIRIKMDEEDDRYLIRISGINKIPPGKIFNLFGLILYYYLKFISGIKPSKSVYGR